MKVGKFHLEQACQRGVVVAIYRGCRFMYYPMESNPFRIESTSDKNDFVAYGGFEKAADYWNNNVAVDRDPNTIDMFGEVQG